MAERTRVVDERFRAMGSSCRIVGHGRGVDAATIRRRVGELEQAWSRFRPDSPISCLNRADGAPVLVSTDVVRLFTVAAEAMCLSDGWFDPSMLGELEALGYDRSHEGLAPPVGPSTAVRPGPPVVGRRPVPIEVDPVVASPGAIVVDSVLGAVVVPPGVAFDPGGLGKGLAADLVVDAVVDAVVDGAAEPAAGLMLDLGGDLRLHGSWVDGGLWPVRVADPLAPGHDLLELRVGGGGVATSSRCRRRWSGTDGRIHHHLLDPRSGRPAESDLLAVTVHASRAWVADVLAKSALVAGRDRAVELLERNGVGAVLVDEHGDVTSVGSVETEVVR